jgi:hypothetical protein
MNPWEIVLHVAPILIGLLLATLKIGSIIKEAIRSEVKPVKESLEGIEKRFLDATRDLWEHNSSQDLRLDAVMKDHYKLAGEHEAKKIRRECSQ